MGLQPCASGALLLPADRVAHAVRGIIAFVVRRTAGTATPGPTRVSPNHRPTAAAAATMPRDAVQETELLLSPYAHDACEAFVLGSGGMAVCGTMRVWETYDQDTLPCAPRQVDTTAAAAEGDISALPSTSAAVLHPNTRKRRR